MTDLSLEKILSAPRLKREFFARDTLTVAQELVGKVLVFDDMAIVIAETEAYIGNKDLASHSHFGKTTRNAVMWEQSGQLYIFLVYGMHLCLNIVTEAPGSPAAVLIRGGVPVSGFEKPIKLDGPGKLTKALGISRKDQTLDVATSARIHVHDIGLTTAVQTTQRIGVEYAGEWAKKPWRFVAQLTHTQIEKLHLTQVAKIYTRQSAPALSRSPGSHITRGRRQ